MDEIIFPKEEAAAPHTHTGTHTSEPCCQQPKAQDIKHTQTKTKISKNEKEMNLKTAEKVKVCRGTGRGRCCCCC